MSKTLCFFHSADKDGHCAGAIVRKYFGDDVEMIGWDYGDPFPWDKIDVHTEVYMVDLSLQPWEDMVRLNTETKKFVWIDHHKSAITDYNAYVDHESKEFYGVWSTAFAACELTWRYLYPDFEMPEAVKLIGRYDVWEWADTIGALEFQAGLRAMETLPTDGVWARLLDASSGLLVRNIIDDGEAIIRYKAKQDRIHIESAGFELNWEGRTWLAINEMFNNSKLFDSMFDANVYAGMLCFGFRKGKWYVSLYAPDKSESSLDMGALAKKYGGGGHPGAAGFTTLVLPFPLGEEPYSSDKKIIDGSIVAGQRRVYEKQYGKMDELTLFRLKRLAIIVGLNPTCLSEEEIIAGIKALEES